MVQLDKLPTRHGKRLLEVFKSVLEVFQSFRSIAWKIMYHIHHQQPGKRQGNATTKKDIGKSIDDQPISLQRRFLGKFEYLPQKNIFVEIRVVSRASRGIAYFWVHGKGYKKGLVFHVEQFTRGGVKQFCLTVELCRVHKRNYFRLLLFSPSSPSQRYYMISVKHFCLTP